MSAQGTNATPTPTLADLFGNNPKAQVKRTTTVDIPQSLRDLFGRAVTAFASAPNTTVVTEDKDTTDAATLYARQIRQYATETKRTAIVKIHDDHFVTWRFSKVTPSARGKSRKASPVTVTQTQAS